MKHIFSPDFWTDKTNAPLHFKSKRTTYGYTAYAIHRPPPSLYQLECIWEGPRDGMQVKGAISKPTTLAWGYLHIFSMYMYGETHVF